MWISDIHLTDFCECQQLLGCNAACQETRRRRLTGVGTGLRMSLEHLRRRRIIVNGMPDHIHAFVGLKPAMAISDLVRDIKNNASNFVNDHHFVKGKFAWQESYGAFSYSHSHIGKVYEYILNQEKHHQKKTFKQEYIDFLKKFEIEYDEKYLFEWYD